MKSIRSLVSLAAAVLMLLVAILSAKAGLASSSVVWEGIESRAGKALAHVAGATSALASSGSLSEEQEAEVQAAETALRKLRSWAAASAKIGAPAWTATQRKQLRADVQVAVAVLEELSIMVGAASGLGSSSLEAALADDVTYLLGVDQRFELVDGASLVVLPNLGQ